MNNYELLQLANYITRKHQSGNTMNASEFEEVLNYKMAMLLRKWLGLPEEYQAIPSTRLGYGKSNHINDSVKPFIEREKSVFLVSGIGLMPFDYYYHLSSHYSLIKSTSCVDTTIRPIQIELCSESEFDVRLSGWYAEATKEYPIMSFAETEIRVAPKSIKEFKMTYVRIPREAVLDVSIDSDPNSPTYGDEIYNATTSVELECNEDDKFVLLGMVLETIGVSLRSQEIMTYAQSMQAGGK